MGSGSQTGRCDMMAILVSAGWVGEWFDGVHIFAPDGDLMVDPSPEAAPYIFGGVNGIAYSDGSQSLYSVYVETQAHRFRK